MERRGTNSYVVARVGQIEDGGHLVTEVGGREIGLLNVGGEYHAFLNRCPHRGGPLCEGEVRSLIAADGVGRLRLDPSSLAVVCPWHGWEFDLATGQSWCEPNGMRAARYPVAVEPGEGLREARPDGRVKGPYVAEKLEVAIDDEYVVVRMRPARGGRATRPATGERRSA